MKVLQNKIVYNVFFSESMLQIVEVEKPGCYFEIKFKIFVFGKQRYYIQIWN